MEKTSSHHPMSFSAINVTRDTYFKRGKTAISELSHEGKTTSHTNIIVMLVLISHPGILTLPSAPFSLTDVSEMRHFRHFSSSTTVASATATAIVYDVDGTRT